MSSLKVSEAEIAVHWQEEEYFHPPAQFIAQANMTDAGVFERFSQENVPECFKEYADLLTVLVEAFEERNYALSGSTPATRLRSLMDEHGLRQRDLLETLGSRGIVSEVVNGKRAISKTQAKKLAEFFHVSAELFI